MGESNQDLAAYWSAIAQIVPVLALALALEARILARRLGRKGNGVRPVTRLAWAVWLIVTWGLLFAVMFTALISLWRDPDAPRHPDSGFDVVLALVAVLNALILVAYVPVNRIASTAIGQPPAKLLLALPWTKPARLKRRIIAAQVELVKDIGETRDLRHLALIQMADTEIAASQTARQRARVAHLLDVAMLSAEQRASAHKHIEDLDHFNESTLEPFRASIRVTLRRIQKREQQIRKWRRGLRNSLKELDSIIENDDRAAEKRLRRLLSDAAES